MNAVVVSPCVNPIPPLNRRLTLTLPRRFYLRVNSINNISTKNTFTALAAKVFYKTPKKGYN